MIVQDVIKSELFLLAWREGKRHGGLANMLAVAFVVRNRVQAGWHGGEWLAVVADHSIHRGEIGSSGHRVIGSSEEKADSSLPLMTTAVEGCPMPVYPDFHDETVRELLGWMDAVFEGTREDLWTDGAKYYSQLDLPQRSWFVENIVRKPEEHPRVATVGPVSFFR